MTSLKANGIQIEYETFGDPSNPTLLLITGLSGQMLHWPSDFCSKIAENGYHVIRFDNRDTGLSTKINGLGPQEIKEKLRALSMGKQTSVPYGLEDMADDSIGILDALDIHTAHICGMSMGGHIAQILCLKYPSRVLSLTSIYSHTGSSSNFMPSREVLEKLFTPTPEERGAYIEYNTEFFRLVSGKGRPFDETFHKDLFGKSFDRCLHVQGIARQYLAIMTQKDRTADLGRLNIPTLVIHGDEDPMIPLAGGEATARAIPNAELMVIKGMGHAFPHLEAFGAEMLQALIGHMKKKGA